MKSSLESRYFVRPENCKSLALDFLGLSRGNYKLLGMMSRRLFAQLSAGCDDPELRDQLEKIQLAASKEEACTAIVEASNSLNMLGALSRVSCLQERDDLVQAALTFYVEGRMEMPMKQLKEGLVVLGVLNALDKHSALFEDLFCGGPPTLSATSLLELFSVEFSPRGSSKRALEEVAVGHWRDCG